MNEELDAFQKRAPDLVNAKGGTKTEAERLRDLWLFHADPDTLMLGEALIGGHMLKARRDAMAKEFTLRADAEIEADPERKAQLLREADEASRAGCIVTRADRLLTALQKTGKRFHLEDASHPDNYAELLRRKQGYVRDIWQILEGKIPPRHPGSAQDNVLILSLNDVRDLRDGRLRHRVVVDLLRELGYLGKRERLDPSKFTLAYKYHWISLRERVSGVFKAECFGGTPNPRGDIT